MLAIIYTLLLGPLCAVFVGIGISTFYRRPESPSAPELHNPDPSPEEKRQADRIYKIHARQMEAYYEVVAALSLVFATVQLAISLGVGPKIGVLGDGILLGGVFTLAYGVGMGVNGGGRIAKFVVAAVSLIAALLLGYLRFLPH